MIKNSKICVSKNLTYLTLFVAIVLTALFVINSTLTMKTSYQSRASEKTYVAQFDQTTGITYVSDGASSVLAVVQTPQNWLDGRGWSVFVPWMGKDPRKPDAPGGVCSVKIDGVSKPISLTFEYVNGFTVTSASKVSSVIMADGTEKCVFDRATGNTLIVHSGKIIGVVSPPVYVKTKMEEKIKVLVPWHSQGRPNNLDRPIGSFTVVTHTDVGEQNSYLGNLTFGYQTSLK